MKKGTKVAVGVGAAAAAAGIIYWATRKDRDEEPYIPPGYEDLLLDYEAVLAELQESRDMYNESLANLEDALNARIDLEIDVAVNTLVDAATDATTAADTATATLGQADIDAAWAAYENELADWNALVALKEAELKIATDAMNANLALAETADAKWETAQAVVNRKVAKIDDVINYTGWVLTLYEHVDLNRFRAGATTELPMGVYRNLHDLPEGVVRGDAASSIMLKEYYQAELWADVNFGGAHQRFVAVDKPLAVNLTGEPIGNDTVSAVTAEPYTDQLYVELETLRQTAGDFETAAVATTAAAGRAALNVQDLLRQGEMVSALGTRLNQTRSTLINVIAKLGDLVGDPITFSVPGEFTTDPAVPGAPYIPEAPEPLPEYTIDILDFTMPGPFGPVYNFFNSADRINLVDWSSSLYDAVFINAVTIQQRLGASELANIDWYRIPDERKVTFF